MPTLSETESSVRGGAVMGQGVHGRTFDAGDVGDAGDAGRDRATLYAELLRPEAQACRWELHLAGGRTVECDAGPARADLIKAVRGAKSFVAKTFIAARNRTAEEAFGLEMEMRGRVLRAYGSDDVAREFTTVTSGLPISLPGRGPSSELVGMRLRMPSVPSVRSMPSKRSGGEDTFYMLSSKCDTPLDRHAFERPGELIEMARDVLDSFARLHAGGMLHADVKLDNMVFCSMAGAKARGRRRRFKLIDWGGSIGESELRDRYMSTQEPKNTCSPMAWYAWGLGPRLTVKAFMLLHARMYRSEFLTSLEFVRFCASSLESFTHAVERIECREHEARGQRGGSGGTRWSRRLSGLLPAERKVRLALLAEHTRSFDLYNLGLALASLAVSTPAGTLDGAVHARVMRLARSLTHYGDADFAGNDAALAWRQSQVSQAE